MYAAIYALPSMYLSKEPGATNGSEESPSMFFPQRVSPNSKLTDKRTDKDG